MSQDDVAYYRERAVAERKLSKASDNADVAAIHEELAEQYEALVERGALRRKLRILVLAGSLDESSGVRKSA